MESEAPFVVGVTGASGAPIARSALRAMHAARAPVALVVSAGAKAVIAEELGEPTSALEGLARETYADTDLAAPIASGSYPTRGMLIVPCSANTLARVALGLTDTLIARAAHVHLKEHRPLVVVPRETPLSAIQLGHMERLAQSGVVVLDAAPPYYTHPKTVDDMVDYLAGKALDHLGIGHRLYQGYRGPSRPT